MMIKKKFKPVLPSLREKKRYLVFQILSEHKFDFKQVRNAVINAVLGFLGQLGASKAGIIFLDDKWSNEMQKGIIRVNHKNVDAVKASLMFANKINNFDVIIRSVGLSGILKKAINSYLR